MHSGARFRPTRPIAAIMMFMTSAEIMRPPEFRPPADHIRTTVNFFHFQRGPRRKGLPLNTPLSRVLVTYGRRSRCDSIRRWPRTGAVLTAAASRRLHYDVIIVLISYTSVSNNVPPSSKIISNACWIFLIYCKYNHLKWLINKCIIYLFIIIFFF